MYCVLAAVSSTGLVSIIVLQAWIWTWYPRVRSKCCQLDCESRWSDLRRCNAGGCDVKLYNFRSWLRAVCLYSWRILKNITDCALLRNKKNSCCLLVCNYCKYEVGSENKFTVRIFCVLSFLSGNNRSDLIF